jgi:hypothetical protein
MRHLSNSFERSASLAKLELEKSELLDGKIGSVSALLNDYRDARLQELAKALTAEEEWLSKKSWYARSTATGRSLTASDELPMGIMLVYEGADENRRRGPEIIILFPYDQTMYQIYMSDAEERTQQNFFFVQEVSARVGELIFEQEQIAGIKV